MTPNDRAARVDEVLHTLESYGDRHKWAGSDPYDGLNATRFVSLLARTVRGRQVITQAVKRCTINLRPVLGIAPQLNSATIAW